MICNYWEKNYTWLLPSWYWSDGTKVTLDGERHSGSVSGSCPLKLVQQRTQRCPCVYGGNRKVLGLGEEAQEARICKPVANGTDQGLPCRVPAH